MVTVTSTASLKAALAVAERQVRQDESQVRQDSARLNQSQAQLARDEQQLSRVQQQEQRVSQTAAPPVPAELTRALQKPLPEQLATAVPKAQVNAQGETIGKLINVVA